MSFEENLRQGLPNNYAKEFDFGVLNQAAIDIKNVLMNHQRLEQLKISIRKTLPENIFCTDLIPISCTDTLNGAIVEASVRIGYFTVGFTMILLNIDAPLSDFQDVKTGGFSKIFSFLHPKENINFVTKRTSIKQSGESYIKTKLLEHLKLKQVIMEFAIYKIADLFEIGPKVVNFGFDIVCYNNAAQFYLERCTDIEQETIQSYRLKYCVRVLHSISFAHRDIKPQNLLYSKSKGKLVLSDYGLSRVVKQRVTQKSKTTFCGTPSYMGQQMKNIQATKLGLVNLFINDMQSASKTLKKKSSSDQGSSTHIISAFSNYDDDQESQVSTTDTNTFKPPTQYVILYQIHRLYKKNKCLDFNEYDWKKFFNNMSQYKRELITKMLDQTKNAQIRNMIYCYGYSSKLLQKLNKIDNDYYYVTRDHFNTTDARKNLRNDFHYHFLEVYKKASQLKNKSNFDKLYQQFQQFYTQLQFLVLNQFKNNIDKQNVPKLLQKMHRINELTQIDPIWDLAIMFVESCLNKNIQKKQRNIQDILNSLKQLKNNNNRQMFRYLSDMLILSYSSDSSIEKAYVYQEIIKVHQHLSPIKQLLNKCYAMKYSKVINKTLYQKYKEQIFLQLKEIVPSQEQGYEQLLSQIKALVLYQKQDYQSSLNEFLKLKKNLVYEYGMNKEVSSTLYSIADCYYKLNMYEQVINTFRSIRSTTGQICSSDYQTIANSHYMLGNYKRAKKYYIQSYNANPNADSYYFIGSCCMQMNQYDKSIKNFQNSIIMKDEQNIVDLNYYEAKVKIIDCEMFSNRQKLLDYFQYKYQQQISNISNDDSIPKDQQISLLNRIYLRLQIIYKKYQQKAKRSLILLLLKNFNYKLDNLYQRAGIYFSVKMYQQAYIYSYASCLSLKANPHTPDYHKSLFFNLKQTISKSLFIHHSQFKLQFQYTISPTSQEYQPIQPLHASIYFNKKLLSLLPILSPFYYKQKFQEFVSTANEIGNKLIKKLKTQE